MRPLKFQITPLHPALIKVSNFAAFLGPRTGSGFGFRSGLVAPSAVVRCSSELRLRASAPLPKLLDDTSGAASWLRRWQTLNSWPSHNGPAEAMDAQSSTGARITVLGQARIGAAEPDLPHLGKAQQWPRRVQLLCRGVRASIIPTQHVSLTGGPVNCFYSRHTCCLE